METKEFKAEITKVVAERFNATVAIHHEDSEIIVWVPWTLPKGSIEYLKDWIHDNKPIDVAVNLSLHVMQYEATGVKDTHTCQYSRTINQEYPRACLVCGVKEAPHEKE